jgi:hypothetical protein
MHHQGSAASNWARSLALVFGIPVLHGGTAIAQILVKPSTVAPDNVTAIQAQPPGTCANYSSTLSTGVTDTNHVPHPGLCRLAEFEMVVEDTTVPVPLPTVPLKQYLQEVSSGKRPAPFTTTQSCFGRSRVCVCRATGLQLNISARVQTSRLNWTSGRPACVAEWNRAQTALNWPDATRLTNLAKQALIDAAQTFQALRPVPCGGGAVHGTPPPHQRLARVVPPDRLVLELEQSLAKVEHNAQLNWTAAMLGFQGAATQSACALHCNVCDYSGWAGTITLNATIDGNNYNESQVQTYFVGGQSSTSGQNTLYPAELDLTNTGSFGSRTWNMGAVTTVGVGCTPQPTSVSCTPPPQSQSVCFNANLDASTNKTSFEPYNAVYTCTGGTDNQIDPNDGHLKSSPYTMNEISPNVLIHNIPQVDISGTPNASRIRDTKHIYDTTDNLPCDEHSAPAGSHCTMDWSWDLFHQ